MSRAPDRGPQPGKIFIGGLNASVTREQVEEFLQPHKPGNVWCVSARLSPLCHVHPPLSYSEFSQSVLGRSRVAPVLGNDHRSCGGTLVCVDCLSFVDSSMRLAFTFGYPIQRESLTGCPDA
jgi:hypothetical protein